MSPPESARPRAQRYPWIL